MTKLRSLLEHDIAREDDRLCSNTQNKLKSTQKQSTPVHPFNNCRRKERKTYFLNFIVA
ncbi:MAG TPA: hypothetical protein VFI70_12375 [Nitrososphaeraceae archaeon]|jgi:hypothetical protein|nr:hypothetical protein [Nitrososphaeraceae archaeon]